MIKSLLLVIPVLFACPISSAFAWSDTGHRVTAIIAYESMKPDKQREILGILREHPQFQKHFTPPQSIAGDQASVDRWQMGVAACWPDIIRGTDEDRPTWHYQLGASLVIGSASDVPEDPGPLPPRATMDTQKLYVLQAIELCRNVYRDKTRARSERAVALCWLLHMIGDLHQPCHAGSLYAKAFRGGDRGANSIRFQGGGNLHAAWDGLLGRSDSPGEVRRRVLDLAPIRDQIQRTAKTRQVYTPKVWVAESRQLARTHVYTHEILGPVQAVERGDASKVPSLKLTPEYFREAGRVARVRVVEAGLRMGILLADWM